MTMCFHFINGNLILCMQIVIPVQVIRLKTIFLAPLHLSNTSDHSRRIGNVQLANAGRTYFLKKTKIQVALIAAASEKYI